jgi:hypothetical protein
MAGETTGSEPRGPSTATAGVTLTDADVLGMLNRADIILTHGGSLTDRAIRWGTGSYWNHAAIVFLLKDEAQGYLRTFVLESEAPRGVDVHPIGKYFDNDDQDMAILRFPDSALPPGHRLDFLKRARGFVLEEIDATYGHSTILQITQTILGPLGWLLKPVIRAMKVLTGLNRGKAVNDFICSGVIQYAYCRACLGANPDTGELWDPFFSDTEARRNLIVNRQTREAFDPAMSFQTLVKQLKLTTPRDFAEAARDNLLECVAQRKKKVWGTQLTEK